MNKKRVVVTGFGTINPVGNNNDEYWNSLILGKSGIDTITNFDVSKHTTKIAGQIKHFELEDHFDKKEIRRNSRFILLGLVAAREAVKMSELEVTKEPELVGVEVGSGIGGIEILENTAKIMLESGPAKVGPFTVPMMIADMAAGSIAIETGAKGPNAASVTACASATHSMGNAFRIIQRGEAVAIITGGCEACVTPLGLASFCAARSLSTNNDDPQGASRPFDLKRDGFVMGEGAGILIFEELEHAKARNAAIYAEVVGFASTGDAYHITAPAPGGEGAKRAMEIAMKDAEIKPNEIDYINAHGTATLLNDKSETHAIKDVLGKVAYDVAISSTKSMTGHLLGAAGAIEAIAMTQAIVHSVVPPTINYQNPDPECDLNYTPNKAIEKNISYAMSNSLGFGGHNAVIIFKKY